jgi:pimeloyl-ACP methyl ester carboxylesterase
MVLLLTRVMQNFLNKPDGGRGWASRFLEQGYEVYIIDQTFRGRSAWRPGAGSTTPTTYSAEIIQQRFTAAQNYMLWPQAINHTQWPGNGTMGDPIFDSFYSSNVQFISNASYQQSTVQAAGAKLLDRIGKPVILLGHSQGGLLPMVLADIRPEHAKAIILLEPTGPPFQEAIFSNASARPYGLTDIPLTYTPPVINPHSDLVQQVYPTMDDKLSSCILQADSPPPRQLVNLAPMPILVLTTDSSYHAVYDHCTVAYLKQAGCSKTQHLELPKVGIFGNGHMVFMEKNSDEVQRLLHQWISELDV